MSVSPDTLHSSPPLSPPATTPAGLAKLLADAYADADALRRELAAARKRADNADRLVQSLQSLRQLPDSTKSPALSQDAAVEILRKWEQRALAAEQARDDADVKRSAIESSWAQLNSYLAQLQSVAADARAGFSRVFDSGGPFVAPGQVPALGHRGRPFPQPAVFPSLPLPPHPGSRRPRTPSIDGYAHPPAKKPRGDYDSNYVDRHSQPRMILPPPDQHKSPHLLTPNTHQRPRSHSRDSSRSSSSSTSVGDMIIQASEGQPNGNGVDPAQHLSHSRRKHRQDDLRTSHISSPHFGTASLSHHHYDHEPHPRRGYPSDYQNVVHDYRSSPKQAGTVIVSGPAGAAEPLAQPGQAREFQTHIFAPVVTGAPVKKTKFPQPSSSTASIPQGPSPGETTVPPPPVAAFPATNEQGQRICRQCGMAGRYKDGKCVEKWGPGPMGPGTVCDRCRKKMKRVERRGTLENQQHQQQQQQQHTAQLIGSATISHLPRPQFHTAVHRADTLPAIPHHFNVSSTRNDVHQPSPRPAPQNSTANSNGNPRAPRSPGPSIAALRDDDVIPRGGTGSRSNSRNGICPPGSTGGRATPLGPPGESKRTSLLKHNSASKRSSRSPGSVMDVDADGDADEDEVDAAFEGLVALGEEAASGRAHMEVDETGDAEQELLEAVDAAEANSNSSGNGGRLEEEE
ncbi:hypothetical protein C0995_011309 [Termitomyces sp. Mi166|nr:hypothetical protein C0995_011309 [Termitomyces sp. Mi166\